MPKAKTPPEAAPPPTPEHKPRRVGKGDKSLGQKIRLRRAEINMSQSALGEKLGVSFQQVQKYEKGVNRVGATRLEEIAAVLDVPMSFFFGETLREKGAAEFQSLLFLDSKFSLRLLRAYTAIKDSQIQHNFVTLMEQVAGVGGAAK